MYRRAYLTLSLLAATSFIHILQWSILRQYYYNQQDRSIHLSHPPTTKKIWQTWRTRVTKLDKNDRGIVDSWSRVNPVYRHEWLSDAAGAEYVWQAPLDEAVRETILSVQDPILRADLLRYALLYIEGGVYADMDTEAHVAVDKWIPFHQLNPKQRVGLVVGIERDLAPDETQEPDVDSRFSLAQYVMYAEPGHPVLESVLRQATSRLRQIAQQREQSLVGLQLTRLEVLHTTGPTLWTQAIMEYLQEQTGKPVSAANFTSLRELRHIHDVVVLPVNAFASGQRHSGSGSNHLNSVLVTHRFRGSWTASHSIPRF